MNTIPLLVNAIESLTTEGDLHLVADGVRIDPFERKVDSYSFNIPADIRALRLRSRASAPSRLGIGRDSRRLGFCIRSLIAQTADESLIITMGPNHELLAEGFYESEGQTQRWTNGDAALPKILFDDLGQAIILTVVAKGLSQYYVNDYVIAEKSSLVISSNFPNDISFITTDGKNSIDVTLNNDEVQLGTTLLTDYDQRIINELNNFSAQEVVHDLPSIYHYWSNKYLLPKIKSFGFINAEDFFVKQISNLFRLYPNEKIRVVSIGAGNCDAEIRISCALISAGFEKFIIDCLDLNPVMLKRGSDSAISNGIEEFINVVEGDFNSWRPACSYHAVMANQSLHHVSNLEHLFASIEQAISLKNGVLITSDMIGMNGHQRWPEALKIVNEFWTVLPDKYKFNHQLKRQEDKFINWNCASDSFEGIRAQDILPLLIDRFHFDLFIPFANIIAPFIDRSFGPNYDTSSELDRSIIDKIHLKDELEISSGRIKPTQMFAVLSLDFSRSMKVSENLTPEFCVRHNMDLDQ